jgi:hypothetical protein
MDVHPPKNGMYTYWSIAIYIYISLSLSLSLYGTMAMGGLDSLQEWAQGGAIDPLSSAQHVKQ